MEHFSHIFLIFVLLSFSFLYVFKNSLRFNLRFLTVFIFVLFLAFHIFPNTIHISHFENLENQGFHDCCINPQLVLVEEASVDKPDQINDYHYLVHEDLKNILPVQLLSSRAPPYYS